MAREKNIYLETKNPLIQRRLDFWLVSDLLQDDISKTDIIPAIKTDHSATNLVFKSVEAHKTSPAYWKFNSQVFYRRSNVQWP